MRKAIGTIVLAWLGALAVIGMWAEIERRRPLQSDGEDSAYSKGISDE